MRVNLSDKPRPKEPLYKETEYKLFVGNLSWNATAQNLQDVFGKCGNVVSARVLYDGDTGRSRGYGFVCYSTKEEMEEALTSLDGTVTYSLFLPKSDFFFVDWHSTTTAGDLFLMKQQISC